MRIQWRAALLGIILCACMAVPVHAISSYVDNMETIQGDSVRNCKGLTLMDASTIQGTGGKTALRLQNANSAGSITYQVRGAQEISLTLYHSQGTFVSLDPKGTGTYLWGVHEGDAGYLASQKIVQALYSPATGNVYYKMGGNYLQLKYSYQNFKEKYFFDPASVQPTASEIAQLMGFGVDVSYSLDGSSYKRLPLHYDRVILPLGGVGDAYLVEEMSASIPSGAVEVLVRLNDISNIPLAEGGSMRWSRPLCAVARVALTGVNLQTGPQPSSSSEGTGSPGSPGSSGNTSESSTGSHTSSNGDSVLGIVADGSYTGEERGGVSSITGIIIFGQRTSGKSSSSSAASAKSSSTAESKFQGVITSSVKPPSVPESRTPKSSAGSGNAKAGETSFVEIAQIGENVASAPGTIVYEIPRKQSLTDSRFSAGVIAYIILVAGGMLFLLLRPKKNKH